MLSYMLDTDISSYLMKRSHPALTQKIRTMYVDDIFISVITKCELLFGIELSPRPQQDLAALDAYLSEINVLGFPEGAATDYAEIRATLKRKGKIIGPNDLVIAAHARHLGLTLVTNNVREFGRVPGLQVENWIEYAN